jgi:pyruvate/2-oxoglutarate/acetoin dehydrogenase E1 component
VLSTSISEAALVGIAIGVSIAGGKAYAEIMFGDFIVNAMDQIINNASKFHHMYGKQFSCDVAIRTPMGGGRGYGPTHSQSLEKIVLGIDNTAVISLSSLLDPSVAIQSISKLECPKVILEHKIDYGSYLYAPIEELQLDLIGGGLGTIRVRPNLAKPEVVVISHGYTARIIANNFEEIFVESDTVFELLAPQLLNPIPLAHFERSIKSSRKVLIVEEATDGFGWADGVASRIAQKFQNCEIVTVSSDPVPIPSKRSLEELNLISVDKISSALKKMGSVNG